jgi:hypothetical protein
MKSALVLFVSLFLGIFVGFATGKTMHRESPQKNREEAALQSKDNSPSPDGGQVRLPGVSETIDFEHLSATKQKEVVTRFGKRIEQFHSQSDLLLLAKAVRNLSFEQAAELLSCLHVPERDERNRDPDAFTIICERMAALDSEKALRLGVDSENGALISVTLNSLSSRSPILALEALAGLPAAIRVNFGFDCDPSRFAPFKGDGDISDFAAIASIVKKHPEAIFDKRFANQLADCLFDSAIRIANTHEIKVNPTEAIASLREMYESLRQYARSAPGKEASDEADRIFFNGASRLIGFFPGIYDALQGQEKEHPFLVEAEAERLKGESLEKAMKFAESQKDAGLVQAAIKGVGYRLDEKTLMQWADSLPDGPAKQGAMQSVAWKGVYSLNGSGKEGGEVCLQLLNQFESDESKIVFLTSAFGNPLLAWNLGLGDRQNTFSEIEKLPLSNAVKAELWRRTAAIPVE